MTFSHTKIQCNQHFSGYNKMGLHKSMATLQIRSHGALHSYHRGKHRCKVQGTSVCPSLLRLSQGCAMLFPSLFITTTVSSSCQWVCDWIHEGTVDALTWWLVGHVGGGIIFRQTQLIPSPIKSAWTCVGSSPSVGSISPTRVAIISSSGAPIESPVGYNQVI